MLPSAALNLERLLSLLRTGVLSAGELRSRLAMSPAAFSRLISAAGDQVCRMGRGRAIKYGRLRTIMNLGSRLPIFRVGVAGEVSGPESSICYRKASIGGIDQRPGGFSQVYRLPSPIWRRKATSGRAFPVASPSFNYLLGSRFGPTIIVSSR